MTQLNESEAALVVEALREQLKVKQFVRDTLVAEGGAVSDGNIPAIEKLMNRLGGTPS